jgi:hypothetical protein
MLSVTLKKVGGCRKSRGRPSVKKDGGMEVERIGSRGLVGTGAGEGLVLASETEEGGGGVSADMESSCSAVLSTWPPAVKHRVVDSRDY